MARAFMTVTSSARAPLDLNADRASTCSVDRAIMGSAPEKRGNERNTDSIEVGKEDEGGASAYVVGQARGDECCSSTDAEDDYTAKRKNTASIVRSQQSVPAIDRREKMGRNEVRQWQMDGMAYSKGRSEGLLRTDRADMLIVAVL